MHLSRTPHRVVVLSCIASGALLGACDEERAPPTGQGGPAPPARVVDTAEVKRKGRLSPPFPLPAVAIHASLLPNGEEVLFWTSHNHASPRPFDNAYLWNVGTGKVTLVGHEGTDVFCSGHAFLPDGRLFVAGGHIANNAGLPDANTFDAATGRWTKHAPMRAGRWYPTVTTLPDGGMLVTSGDDEHMRNNAVPEVWEAATGRWRLLEGAWRPLPLYPWMHVAPDGRVFYAGPEPQTAFLDAAGAGAWSPGPRAGNGIVRDYGSSVMYEPGKVLNVGGGIPPTATAETIDLRGDGVWRSTGSMRHPRRHHTATLLADGTVLVTGGTVGPGHNDGAGAVLPTELWDPATGEWRELASLARKRLYHSVALLLPDATVLVAGSGWPAAIGERDELTGEVLTPPYLFSPDGSPARRPEISSAPGRVGYGEEMRVETPSAPRIASVTWVRLPSVTHAIDMNQRFLRLPFTTGGGGAPRSGDPGSLRVRTPEGPNLAPPGHYMMFLVDRDGVPSVARIVRIG